jgi:hypothetical protein
MQDALRTIMFTIIGLVILWFIAMTVDTHIFLDTDIDTVVFGTVPMNRTDIGDRCGQEYVNDTTLVDYKMNSSGAMVYLCPLGLSPIRTKVTANSIPDAFRRTLTPPQQIKVLSYYPVAPAAAAAPVTTAPAATAPQPVAPTSAPATTPAPPMSSEPPPVENSSTPVPAPAAPAQ